MNPVTLKAPAKLNLGLTIVGRRPNGYHELESLFWPISLTDTLTFAPADRFSLTLSGAEIPTENNLITKALSAVDKESRWKVTVEKQIPVGGGLGGGSSNAGATLRFLAQAHSLRLDNLSEKALQLVADVPFFLHTKPAWVTGVGERVQPLDFDPSLLSQLSFLLVLPPFGVPTKDVFGAYQESGVPFSTRQSAPTSEKFWSYLSNARNDLEPFACALFPELGEVLSALRDTPCKYAGLSGTGSTCFAAFPSPTDCEKSLKVLQRCFRKYNCRSLRTETFLG